MYTKNQAITYKYLTKFYYCFLLILHMLEIYRGQYKLGKFKRVSLSKNENKI